MERAAAAAAAPEGFGASEMPSLGRPRGAAAAAAAAAAAGAAEAVASAAEEADAEELEALASAPPFLIPSTCFATFSSLMCAKFAGLRARIL